VRNYFENVWKYVVLLFVSHFSQNDNQKGEHVNNFKVKLKSCNHVALHADWEHHLASTDYHTGVKKHDQNKEESTNRGEQNVQFSIVSFTTSSVSRECKNDNSCSANMTPAAESIGATLLKSSTPSIFGK